LQESHYYCLASALLPVDSYFSIFLLLNANLALFKSSVLPRSDRLFYFANLKAPAFNSAPLSPSERTFEEDKTYRILPAPGTTASRLFWVKQFEQGLDVSFINRPETRQEELTLV
jgi:hypothetical protein